MPKVTERKVMKSGRKALVITFPNASSDYYKIKTGDQLPVVTDGVLTVHPPEAASR